MESIAVLQHGIAPAQEITTALFQNFVEYIDRTERTTKAYLTNLRQFMAWLRYKALNRPARKDIILYRDWLSSEHEAISFDPETVEGWSYRTDRNGNPVKVTCRATTVKAYLQSVKAFFGWTAASGLYPNIAANIHAPKITETHRKDSLTADEVLSIEASISSRATARTEEAGGAGKDIAGRIQRSTEQGKRLFAMYLLTVNAGLRTVEISRANLQDIETRNGQSFLYIWGKGHSAPDQKKPLAPEVKAAIDDYIQSRTDNPTGASPLFVSTGNRSHGKRIASTTISTMLKRAMQEAGFDSERLTAHSLRHTTAQNVMELTGNNIYMTQQYLRHQSPHTTEIYLQNDTAEQDASIARQLYQRFHGGKDTETGNREKLEDILSKMNPEKLGKLLELAQIMQG